MLMAELDIIIPVFNEGEGIVRTLRALERGVKTPCSVKLCYDFDEDDTLPAVIALKDLAITVEFVKNRGRGPHAAVLTGMAASQAPYVLVFPADDDYNAGIVDAMVAKARDGNKIVCASRFIPGGEMRGCPLVKAVILRTAAATLHLHARVPTRDPTNGFRLFSRSLLDTVPITSDTGFTYSIELLVKCHRLGWPIAEVPARWFERASGQSRFRVFRWGPAYLRWCAYAFATTYLGRKTL